MYILISIDFVEAKKKISRCLIKTFAIFRRVLQNIQNILFYRVQQTTRVGHFHPLGHRNHPYRPVPHVSNQFTQRSPTVHLYHCQRHSRHLRPFNGLGHLHEARYQTKTAFSALAHLRHVFHRLNHGHLHFLGIFVVFRTHSSGHIFTRCQWGLTGPLDLLLAKRTRTLYRVWPTNRPD